MRRNAMKAKNSDKNSEKKSIRIAAPETLSDEKISARRLWGCPDGIAQPLVDPDSVSALTKRNNIQWA